jgi:hypothetical protein
LNHPSADPSSSCKLIHASVALAVLTHLIPHNPQDRQLTDRELAGQCRRHRTRRSEVPSPGNRDRTLRSPLQPPGWEERRSAGWDAHRLDLAPEDASSGVQALGQSLGIIIAHSAGGEALPD